MHRLRSNRSRGLLLGLLALGSVAAVPHFGAAQQPTGVIPQIRRPAGPARPVPAVSPVPASPAPAAMTAAPVTPQPGSRIPATTPQLPSRAAPTAFFAEAATSITPQPTGIPATQPGEHPLAIAVNRAKTSMQSIAKIQDYSATLVKRERIDGVLGEHEYLFVKVRHNPFSVYIYFLAPTALKGQESIFVAGKNDGNLLAHPNGLKAKLIGTISLKPTGMLAMQGNRHPITEVGIKRLTERLIEVGEHDMQFGECAVKVMPGAKINGRDTTCYEVNHPYPRKEFIFHIARIYVDTELNVPIRHEAYEWPTEKGGEPVLIEEYTYLNLKLNNGFTDLDFDVANPKYQFK